MAKKHLKYLPLLSTRYKKEPYSLHTLIFMSFNENLYLSRIVIIKNVNTVLCEFSIIKLFFVIMETRNRKEIKECLKSND